MAQINSKSRIGNYLLSLCNMTYRLILFLCLLSAVAFCQVDDYALKPPRDYDKKPARNAAFIEIAGNSTLYSLSFDRIYYYREKFKMSVRGGFALLPNSRHLEQTYIAEHCFILFSNPHHLEFSAGLTLQRRYNGKPDDPEVYFWENIWFGVWRCGYRYQKQEEGFFFRAGLTPVMMSKDAEGFHPGYFQLWAGIGVGTSF